MQEGPCWGGFGLGATYQRGGYAAEQQRRSIRNGYGFVCAFPLDKECSGMVQIPFCYQGVEAALLSQIRGVF